MLDARITAIIEAALEQDKTVEVRRENDKIVVFETTRKLKTKVPMG